MILWWGEIKEENKWEMKMPKNKSSSATSLKTHQFKLKLAKKDGSAKSEDIPQKPTKHFSVKYKVTLTNEDKL